MTERKRKSGDDPTARRGKVRSISDMLPAVGGAAFRRFGFVQSAIVSRWPEIVGPRYADVSVPESIRFPVGKRSEGVLTLMVDSAHAPMMQHVGPALVERVNRFFGYTAIIKVTLRQGAVRVEPRPRRPAAGLRPVPTDLSDSLRSIADPELRECLTALAGALVASDGPPIVDKDVPWGS